MCGDSFLSPVRCLWTRWRAAAVESDDTYEAFETLRIFQESRALKISRQRCCRSYIVSCGH